MRLIYIFLFTLTCFLPAELQAQRCGTVHRDVRPENELLLQQWISDHAGELQSRSVITIPVVVHVIWNKQEQNISDEQLYSQIEALNKDFRAQNIEVPTIPSVFQPLIADVEIEFCLAGYDPNGNPTNGITRTFTINSVGIGGSPSIHYSAQGGADAWDPTRYLNIWVAKFAGGIGGVSSFPGEGPIEEDGVQIDYRQFGTILVEPPYHLGRTLTHELGHYFNLEHPWGPGFNDCCADDLVADTPQSCETYINQCPVHPMVSCDEPDLFMNYMFYTNDACMGMFTLGQKARMLATLNTLRPGLIIGMECATTDDGEELRESSLAIFGNPVSEFLTFKIESKTTGIWKAELYDLTGRVVAQKGRVVAGLIQSISVEDLPGGVYFLKLEREGESVVEKVVIGR